MRRLSAEAGNRRRNKRTFILEGLLRSCEGQLKKLAGGAGEGLDLVELSGSQVAVFRRSSLRRKRRS